MVAAPDKKLNKTAFITEHLHKNPKANAKAVKAAWQKAGRDGTISGTLVQKVRAGLGLAGNLRSRSRHVKNSGATSATTKGRSTSKSNGKSRAHANGTHATLALETRTRSSSRERILEEAEGDIDRLIFKLMGVGGMEKVEDTLRLARRMVVRSHAE
jgi:hypothetical protein